MGKSSSFTVPDFQAKPFSWDATDSIIQKLQAVPKGTEIFETGLKPQEAETFVEWIVAGTALRLEQLHPRNGRDWGDFCDSKCTIANGIVRDITADLPPHLLHHFNMRQIGGVPHAAMVIDLPVQHPDSGEVTLKHYLVDPTFAQFNGTLELNRLTETQEGRDFATQLLENGNVEITQETARLYVAAFVSLRLIPDNKLAKHNDSCLELLRAREMDTIAMSGTKLPKGIFFSR